MFLKSGRFVPPDEVISLRGAYEEGKQAQLALDQQHEEKAVMQAVLDEQNVMAQAYKSQVERIFREIEKLSRPMNTNMTGISLSRDEWQALKKQEGIGE